MDPDDSIIHATRSGGWDYLRCQNDQQIHKFTPARYDSFENEKWKVSFGSNKPFQCTAEFEKGGNNGTYRPSLSRIHLSESKGP